MRKSLFLFLALAKLTWASVHVSFLNTHEYFLYTIDEPALTFSKDSQAQITVLSSKKWPNNSILSCYHVVLTPKQERFDFILRDQALHFKKIPENSSKFLLGGDVYHEKKALPKVFNALKKQKADALVLGGDVAYTTHRANPFLTLRWEANRWKTFFTYYQKYTTSDQGRLLPIVSCIGNHDVHRRSRNLFFDVFPIKKRGYEKLDLGSLQVFILDTDNVTPIAGKQTKWLEESLKTPFKGMRIAVYHHPSYPTIQPFNNRRAKEIRKNWIPLMQNYGVQVSFEHHSHVYKKCIPLLAEGFNHPLIIVGDGCLGVKPRTTTRKENQRYLANCTPINHFFLLHLDMAHIHIKVCDLEGCLIDHVPLPKIVLKNE